MNKFSALLLVGFCIVNRANQECNWGVWINVYPMAAQQCNYIQDNDFFYTSFIFNCESISEGRWDYYTSDDCSGSPINSTHPSVFNCADVTCDSGILWSMDEHDNDDCSGSGDTFFTGYMAEVDICVDVSNSNSINVNTTADSISLVFYDNSNCSGSTSLKFNFTDDTCDTNGGNSSQTMISEWPNDGSDSDSDSGTDSDAALVTDRNGIAFHFSIVLVGLSLFF